jgi:hypothetical protein
MFVYSLENLRADLLTKIVRLWLIRRINRTRKERMLKNLDAIAYKRWCKSKE